MKKYRFYIGILIGLTWSITGCVNHHLPADAAGYPEDIAQIIQTECATSGCHNETSKAAAAGLSLSSWEAMMEGGRNGSVAIPFSHGFSTLFLFTNTYDDLGVSVTPTMPYGAPPLSREDVLKIRFWLNDGAPNADGFVKFSDNPDRQKYYVLNRGCDMVAVFDAETDRIMRYVRTTFGLDVEEAQRIVVAPDGKYWYVVLPGSGVLKRYDATTDELAGELIMSPGNWSNLCISENSENAVIINSDADGAMAYLDLESMSVVEEYGGGGMFSRPQYPCLNPDMCILYVTPETGNFLYRVDLTDPLAATMMEVPLEAGLTPSTASFHDPREVFFHPDDTRYYVTCNATNEVKVYLNANDSLIASIPVANGPFKMAYSAAHDQLFVTCPEDNLTFPGKLGAVSVLDCSTNSLLKNLYAGSQPLGIAVEDARDRVIVANRNFSDEGPEPHHVTECEGRNGYVTYISLIDLELIAGEKYEVVSDPIEVSLRY